jgi:iron(III) transport system ATP-binding protein
MTAPYVSISNLSVAFGPTPAVDRVGFDVGSGEHVTLLGPSGCGKTTTLRAIAGLERPSSGRIIIDGKPVYDAAAGHNLPPEKRGLSMVFQSYAIWPHMTVFDNVAFSFKVRGIPRARTRPAVEKALALVDLAGFAKRSATELSGGQQQRVALARAIAYESKVILFDEPLSNLDAQLRIAMRNELADLRRRLGFTAVYVTHDQDEAFSLSDRIIVMRAGRIEQQGSPAELYGLPRTRFVASFLGVKNILDAEVGTTAPGERVEARLAPELVMSATAPWGSQPGKRSAVGFRPMDVRLTTGADSTAGISGTMVRRLFVGDLVHYFVRTGAIEICAFDRPRAELTEGTAVRWQVAPESCLVLQD